MWYPGALRYTIWNQISALVSGEQLWHHKPGSWMRFKEPGTSYQTQGKQTLKFQRGHTISPRLAKVLIPALCGTSWRRATRADLCFFFSLKKEGSSRTAWLLVGESCRKCLPRTSQERKSHIPCRLGSSLLHDQGLRLDPEFLTAVLGRVCLCGWAAGWRRVPGLRHTDSHTPAWMVVSAQEGSTPVHRGRESARQKRLIHPPFFVLWKNCS